MKTYEETWTVGTCGNPTHRAESLCYSLRDGNGDGLKLTPERMRLAAQAPAMARLLRAVLGHEIDSEDLIDRAKLYAVLRDAGVISDDPPCDHGSNH